MACEEAIARTQAVQLRAPARLGRLRGDTRSAAAEVALAVADPVDGQILDVGRTRYRPPAALHDLVRIRDRTCRHPGCHRPSHHGDIDHHVEWTRHDGHTSGANLLGFCRKHHRLKDYPGWTHHLDENTGTLTVTTPTGHSHTSLPDEPPS